MEIPRGGNPEPEPSQPEPTREELVKELRVLEAWLATQTPGMGDAMDRLSDWIDKYIADYERAKQIRDILENLPSKT